MKIIITESQFKILYEGRSVTYTGKIMDDISKHPDLKRLDLRTFASGTMGLFRYTDGNAYEIVVRPVKYGEFKADYGDIIKKKIDRLGFKPNKEEPRSIDDIKDTIQSRLSGKDIGVEIKSNKNTKEIYQFKVRLSGYDENILKHRIIDLMDEPFFTVKKIKDDKGMFDIHRYYLIVTYKKL